MDNEEEYSLRGFSAILADIAEDYHIAAGDVLLLMQKHSEECGEWFTKGENYANSIDGKMMEQIRKETDEKSN